MTLSEKSKKTSYVIVATLGGIGWIFGMLNDVPGAVERYWEKLPSLLQNGHVWLSLCYVLTIAGTLLWIWWQPSSDMTHEVKHDYGVAPTAVMQFVKSFCDDVVRAHKSNDESMEKTIVRTATEHTFPLLVEQLFDKDERVRFESEIARLKKTKVDHLTLGLAACEFLSLLCSKDFKAREDQIRNQLRELLVQGD